MTSPRLRRTLIAVLALATLLTVVPSSGATVSPSRVGVFRGSGRADLVGQYETWIGQPVGYTVDFIGRTSTSDPAPWAALDNPSWWCKRWVARPSTLVLSTAILPNSNFSLAAGARGDYDAHWKKFGQAMVAGGCGDAILRLGWEFNGKFYPWAAGGKEASFAAYWRRIVTTLRAVPNQRFLFDWTPLAGNANANVEAAYPGDAYVDIIGLDAYDTSNISTSKPAARWNDQVSRRYGLAWQRTFALGHGKAMSLPEWGVWDRTQAGGGGDNPEYITRMVEWIRSNPFLYASYFEVDASDGAHRLMTSQFPRSSAAFRTAVGGATL
ncbi:MAG: glycoside hydrolase family 26 protein [Microthrixaceae bacterium]